MPIFRLLLISSARACCSGVRMAIFQTAANARPELKLAGLLLLLLAGAPDAVRAQSSPTISIVLSPGHMVPQNTVITATVTLDNLDPASYSSLVFRVDLTEWDPHFPTDSARCEGDDMDEDIPVEVDASRETFTVEVWKSCSAYIYAYYALDAALVRLPGRVELASAETRFAMTTFLDYPACWRRATRFFYAEALPAWRKRTPSAAGARGGGRGEP